MGREKRSAGASSSGASAALGGGAASGVASLFGARPSALASAPTGSPSRPGASSPGLELGADVLPDQSNVDAELQRLMARLAKKDSATRIKALGDIALAVATTPRGRDGGGLGAAGGAAEGGRDVGSRVISAIPTWLYHYRRLVLDGDRAVRQGAAQANIAMSTSAGRALAPFLQSVALPWWLAMHDPEEDAAVRVSRAGWEALFPDPAKRAAALARVRLYLVRQLCATLALSKASLVEARFEGVPSEEAEQRADRLLGASTLGLSALLAGVPSAGDLDHDGVHEEVLNLSKGPSLGKLIAGQGSARAAVSVRKAAYRLLGALCGYLKAEQERRGGSGRDVCVAEGSGLLPILVAALGCEGETSCQAELVAAIVVAAGAFPQEAWAGPLPEVLRSWLASGARGAAPGAAPFLLPLMATLPASELREEAIGIIAHIASGESACAHDAASSSSLRDAAVECLVYAAVKAGGDVARDGSRTSAASELLDDVAFTHFWPKTGGTRRPLSMAALLNARALVPGGSLEQEGRALARRIFADVAAELLELEGEEECVTALANEFKGAHLRGAFAEALAAAWAASDGLPYTSEGENATASVLSWLLALTEVDVAPVLPGANVQLATQIARCTRRSAPVRSDAADLFVRLTGGLWSVGETTRGDAFRDALYGVLVDEAIIEDPPQFLVALPTALAKCHGRDYEAWYRYRSEKLDNYARNVLLGPHVKDVVFEPPELAGKKQVAVVAALLGESFRPALLRPRDNKLLHKRLCWRLKLWTQLDGGGDPLESRPGEGPPDLYQIIDAGLARREPAPMLLLECCARCILRPAPEDPESMDEMDPVSVPRMVVLESTVPKDDDPSTEADVSLLPPVTDRVTRDPHLTRLLMIKHYGHRMVRDRFAHRPSEHGQGVNAMGGAETGGPDDPEISVEPLWEVWEAVWKLCSQEERIELALDSPARRSVVKLAFAEAQLESLARRARVNDGGCRRDALTPIGYEEAMSASFVVNEALAKFCTNESHRETVAAMLCRDPGFLWAVLKEEVVRRGYGFPQLVSKRRILVLAALFSFGEDLATCWMSSGPFDFSSAASTLAAYLGADASPVFMARCLPHVISWGLSERGPATIDAILRALVPECPSNVDAVPTSFEKLAEPAKGTPPPTREWMSDLPILEERCVAEEAWTGVLPASCIADVSSWLFPCVISRIAPGDARSLFRRSHLFGRLDLPVLLEEALEVQSKLSFRAEHARVVAKSCALVIRRMLRPITTDHEDYLSLAVAEWGSLNGAAAWDAEQVAAEWREAARQCCHSRAGCAPQVLDACSAVAVATFGRQGVHGPGGADLGNRLLYLELFRSFALPLLADSAPDPTDLWGSDISQACILRHVASVFEVVSSLLDHEELIVMLSFIQGKLVSDHVEGGVPASRTAAFCAATSALTTRTLWLPAVLRSNSEAATFAWESFCDDVTLSALDGVVTANLLGGADTHALPETLQDWQAECLAVTPREVLGQLVLEDSIGPLISLIREHPSQRMQRAAYAALLASDAQFTYTDADGEVFVDEEDDKVEGPSSPAPVAEPTRFAIPVDLLEALHNPPTAEQVRDHSDHRGLGSYLLLWSAFLEHLRRNSGSEANNEWATAAVLAVREGGAATACFSVAFAVASASHVPEPAVARSPRKGAGGEKAPKSPVSSHGYFACLDRASQAWDGRMEGFFDADVTHFAGRDEMSEGHEPVEGTAGGTHKGPPAGEPWSMVRVGRLVLLRLLQHIPSVARVWFTEEIPRSMQAQVEAFCAEHVSPVLIAQELEAVAWEAAKKPKVVCGGDGKPLPPALQPVEPLKLAVRRGRNEAVATYKQDESTLELRVKLPGAYPLRAVDVEGPRRAGVSERTSRRWLLGILTYLRNGDGCVLDAIRMWRRHVEAAFDGVEECAVCYFVVHASNHSLPTKPCPQCKHKFHRACLVKWFNTSHKTNCPLCRGAFNFRIRNPELPPAMRGLPPDVQQELIAMGMHLQM